MGGFDELGPRRRQRVVLSERRRSALGSARALGALLAGATIATAGPAAAQVVPKPRPTAATDVAKAAKSDPAKSDPAKSDPAKSDPAKPDCVTETAKPAKSDTGKDIKKPTQPDSATDVPKPVRVIG
jgi:hypothetical protein